MSVRVEVSAAVRRGMPYRRFEAALWSTLFESYLPRSLEIVPADRLLITVDGQADTPAAEEVRTIVWGLTHPDLIDAFPC